MQKLCCSIFLLLPYVMTSQTLQGKVYDGEAIVSGAKVINITQNILTYTNEQGHFKLEAAIHDSILLKSLFHLEKRFVLSKKDLDEIMVIELKKAINDLDEVFIKSEPEFKAFDPIVANATLKNQIQEDLKRNPHLYSKPSNGNMDFMAIGAMIVKLFKSKKPQAELQASATYPDFKRFFETDAYFTMQFLEDELKIPEDYEYVFMHYCEAQSIDIKLLLVENRFLLLDDFLKYSAEFLEILKADKKD